MRSTECPSSVWYEFVEVYGVEVNTDVELESIPKHCLLPTEVAQLTQVNVYSGVYIFI